MANYDSNVTRYKGTVDIEEKTIIPQATDRAGNLSNYYQEVDKSGVISMQLSTTDASAAVTWTLQVSLDGTTWATAKDSNGDDITGTVDVDAPVVDVFRVARKVYVRVSLTVTTETGNISYILKPGDNEN